MLSDVGALGKVMGLVNLWDPDVEIHDRMAGEFNMLVEEIFAKTGDVDVARNSALATLRRTWGVTSIGGRRWQKYAPEAVYANAAGIDWIHEQIREDLESLEVIPKITEEEPIRLEPDFLTAREGLPTYVAMALDEHGAWAPLPVPPIRPDYATSPAKRRSDAEAEAHLAAMREKRGSLEARQRGLLAGAVPPEVFH